MTFEELKKFPNVKSKIPLWENIDPPFWDQIVSVTKTNKKNVSFDYIVKFSDGLIMEY